jgi:hypothetical protein
MNGTRWLYATLDFDINKGVVGRPTYSANSLMGRSAERDAAFEAAKEEGLLAVLDFLGIYGWEMAGSAFGKNGQGFFIFKRPTPGQEI